MDIGTYLSHTARQTEADTMPHDYRARDPYLAAAREHTSGRETTPTVATLHGDVPLPQYLEEALHEVYGSPHCIKLSSAGQLVATVTGRRNDGVSAVEVAYDEGHRLGRVVSDWIRSRQQHRTPHTIPVVVSEIPWTPTGPIDPTGRARGVHDVPRRDEERRDEGDPSAHHVSHTNWPERGSHPCFGCGVELLAGAAHTLCVRCRTQEWVSADPRKQDWGPVGRTPKIEKLLNASGRIVGFTCDEHGWFQGLPSAHIRAAHRGGSHTCARCTRVIPRSTDTCVKCRLRYEGGRVPSGVAKDHLTQAQKIADTTWDIQRAHRETVLLRPTGMSKVGRGVGHFFTTAPIACRIALGVIICWWVVFAGLMIGALL